MYNLINITRHTLRHLCGKAHALFSHKEPVPQELKAALSECNNMHELLDLLFATDVPRDEAFLSLFEQRIQEIDAAC